MITKKFVVECEEGFHLRPAQVLMEAATPFQSEITLKTQDDEEANAKSILNLMSLGLEKGAEVVVEVEGPDEAAAMQMVENLFESNFNE